MQTKHWLQSGHFFGTDSEYVLFEPRIPANWLPSDAAEKHSFCHLVAEGLTPGNLTNICNQEPENFQVVHFLSHQRHEG